MLLVAITSACIYSAAVQTHCSATAPLVVFETFEACDIAVREVAKDTRQSISKLDGVIRVEISAGCSTPEEAVRIINALPAFYADKGATYSIRTR